MTAQNIVQITQVVPTGSTVGFQLLGGATLTRDSGGGWQVVDRPRRQASTEWLDYGPFTMTLPLMIDGVKGVSGTSIEGLIGVVENWEAPAGIEPPKLQVSGPVPHTDLLWVCKPTQWPEDAIRDPQTGFRWQQKLTLTLLQYVPPTVAVTSPSPAAAAAQRQATTTTSPPSSRTYTVKAGDTLSAIAVRFFGNYRRDADIAALNGIRDMNVIQVGQVLKLPAS